MVDIESVDLDNINNSSQFYLDAMEQLKKEYEKMDKKREKLQEYLETLLKNNLELNGMIEGLLMLMENVDLPYALEGLLEMIARKSSGLTNNLVKDVAIQVLRGNGSIDI